jgi:hypothetical protein
LSILLDTNVALYLLQGRLAVPLPVEPTFISVISEMEMLGYPDLSEDEERAIRSFAASVRVVQLVLPVQEAAIRLRRERRLRLPDAIVAASAMVALAKPGPLRRRAVRVDLSTLRAPRRPNRVTAARRSTRDR